MKRYILFIVTLILLVHVNAKDNRKPNIVFIVVDDLGWTDLSCYGSDLYQTPNIDKLAEQGVSFRNGYSACTVCSPTRAALMSGKYPARINCTDWIKGWKFPKAKLKVPKWTMYMDTAEYTIAEAFRDAGYKTGHFGKWHLGENEIYWPENQGFDINKGGWKSGGPHRNKNKGYKGYFPPFGNPRLKDLPDDEYLTERLASETCSFIDENKEEPFFINLWFYNVHTPLMAKQNKIDKYKSLVKASNNHKNPIYAAMVEHVDDAIGLVLKHLEQNNLMNNTIIVFTSDNGGLIRENNRVTSNYPLREGKGHVYEGGVRVPAIILIPENTHSGMVSEVPLISMDFYPTLIELAGIEVPKNIQQSWDGISLVKVLNGEEIQKQRSLFWHYPHYHAQGATPYSSIRSGNYKLIRFFEDERYELYNLTDDLSEENNLIDQYTQKAKELKTELFNWYQEVDAQMPTMNPNYSK